MHEKPKQAMGVAIRCILEAEIKEGFMEKKRLYLFFAAFFAALALALVVVSVTTGNVIYSVYALIPLIIAIALSALGGVLRLKR